jgi:F-type H+-transporting ATPase subunit epsilon
MKLGVYSLKRVLYKGQASSLTAKTMSGEITVLENHRPLISILTKGIVKIIDKSGKEHYFPIDGGFLEVSFNDVKLIIEEEQAAA